jgi:hypothetical protein
LKNMMWVRGRGHLMCLIKRLLRDRDRGLLTFESVQQAHPMPHFMDGCHTAVVAGKRARGHGMRINTAAVIFVDRRVRFAVCNRTRECTPPQYTTTQISLETQIQRLVSALAQAILHSSVIVLLSHGTSVVCRPRHVYGVELDVVGGVGVVQSFELGAGHRVCEAGLADCFGDNVEDGVYGYRACGSCGAGCVGGRRPGIGIAAMQGFGGLEEVIGSARGVGAAVERLDMRSLFACQSQEA